MPPSIAARTIRTLSSSERPGRAMCQPPSPASETTSPVRPSFRRAVPPLGPGAAMPPVVPHPAAGATVAASASRRKSLRVIPPSPA